MINKGSYKDDSILVKFVTYEDDGKETYIAGYYTTAYEQTLKMFILAQQYNIECWFNEHSGVVKEEYKQYSYWVETVYLCLGAHNEEEEDATAIKVVIK